MKKPSKAAMKNERRIDLLTKQLKESLSVEEQNELCQLQAEDSARLVSFIRSRNAQQLAVFIAAFRVKQATKKKVKHGKA